MPRPLMRPAGTRGVIAMQFRCERQRCGLPIHVELREDHAGLYHVTVLRDDAGHIHLIARRRGRHGCPKPATTTP